MPEKLRCISVDVEDGEPEGIVWAEPADQRVAGAFLDVVREYAEELEDGQSVTITIRRHDLTPEELDAIPEM